MSWSSTVEVIQLSVSVSTEAVSLAGESFELIRVFSRQEELKIEPATNNSSPAHELIRYLRN